MARNVADFRPDKCAAPYTGWSPLPNQIPPLAAPYIQPACCPLLPMPCGMFKEKSIVPAQQPVVPVPVYQEIQKRDCIVEVPQTVVFDKIIPKIYKQQVEYEVPNLNLQCNLQTIAIPQVEYKEKTIDVQVPVGMKYAVQQKWQTREVPKLVPRYVGKPEDIYVEIPQVKIVDKIVEKEVSVYVGEKIIRKQVIEEEPIDVFQYKYVEKEEEVFVYKYKPVFDVEVDIPPPLIVPVPVEPEEKQLDPARMTLDEWKKMRLGGFSTCCNQNESCGPDPDIPSALCCTCCVTPCQPGNCCSPSGACGICCGRSLCMCCQGCTRCCDTRPPQLA